MDFSGKEFIAILILEILFGAFLGWAITADSFEHKFCEYKNSTWLTNGICVDNDGRIIRVFAK